MRTRSGIALLAAAAALLPAACLSVSTPQREQHLIKLTRDAASLPHVEAGGTALGRGTLRIHRVRVSPLFEGTSFVYRRDDTVYETDFYRLFFSPPSTVLLTAVNRWLGASPLFTRTLRPIDAARADWILEGLVRELYVDLRGERPEAVIVIDFQLLDAHSPRLDSLLDEIYSARRPVDGDSGEAIVLAWSEGMTEIMRSLEADLYRVVPAPAEPRS